MKEKYKEQIEKLGNILLTALISALIAWLQAMLVDVKEITVATPNPEEAGVLGAFARSIVEVMNRRA